jgi:hypothetical protein
MAAISDSKEPTGDIISIDEGNFKVEVKVEKV